jgi:hypothetical protein
LERLEAAVRLLVVAMHLPQVGSVVVPLQRYHPLQVGLAAAAVPPLEAVLVLDHRRLVAVLQQLLRRSVWLQHLLLQQVLVGSGRIPLEVQYPRHRRLVVAVLVLGLARLHRLLLRLVGAEGLVQAHRRRPQQPFRLVVVAEEGSVPARRLPRLLRLGAEEEEGLVPARRLPVVGEGLVALVGLEEVGLGVALGVGVLAATHKLLRSEEQAPTKLPPVANQTHPEGSLGHVERTSRLMWWCVASNSTRADPFAHVGCGLPFFF